MKRNVFLLFTISCIALTLYPVISAQAEPPSDSMMRRCGDGMIDIMIAPFDIINHMEDVRYKDGMLPAMTYGAMKGMSGALTRTMFGLYEIVTFYVPEHNSLKYDPQFDSAVFRFE
ncbi:MAG: exosortase system-associated protein, TIGR04073 family [Candidatus Omnitrophica bacterium]|nr:exosortase system-associated protein, TIGR04073 family [Candidatus Omnitrophota bacterium]